MISRVIVDKKLLASFRKQAITAYPNETMQTLWGHIEGDTVIVSSLRDLPHIASEDSVQYKPADAILHHGTGEAYLGTWHSHPDVSDAAPSEADWNSSFTTGEHIFLITWIRKDEKDRFKTGVRPWEPRPEIAIVHPKIRVQDGVKRKSPKACVHTAEAPLETVLPDAKIVMNRKEASVNERMPNIKQELSTCTEANVSVVEKQNLLS